MKIFDRLRLVALLPAIVLLPAALGINALAKHNTPEALEARIAPEGALNVVDAAAATAAAAADDAPADGAAVHAKACVACHGAGIAGAPRTGDAAAWATRIAQGMEVLIEHAIGGFQGETGVMPAKGGNPSLRDAEVAAAVRYMVEQSQ